MTAALGVLLDVGGRARRNDLGESMTLLTFAGRPSRRRSGDISRSSRAATAHRSGPEPEG
ncbi:hypothetical protein ASG80_00205 [Agromyces sp. Soil535]|nr:hypothetical protein ASG80_00205 [Agromyces sp. Soil535]